MWLALDIGLLRDVQGRARRGMRVIVPPAPSCIVQVSAAAVWDGEHARFGELRLDIYDGRDGQRDPWHPTRLWASDNAGADAWLVTFGGRWSFLPLLRQACCIADIAFPIGVVTTDPTRGGRARSEWHFDIADALGCSSSPWCLAGLIAACGAPEALAEHVGRADHRGALLRAVATCLVHIRLLAQAGRTDGSGRAATEAALIEALAGEDEHSGAARQLAEVLASRADVITSAS